MILANTSRIPIPDQISKVVFLKQTFSFDNFIAVDTSSQYRCNCNEDYI